MEGALSKSYEPNITMMPKPDKNKTEEYYRPISLMNLEIKKIFFNKKCIYKSYASLVEYVKMNPCNLLYQYAKEENAYDHMN